MRNRLGFVHRCEPAGHGASTRLLPPGTGGEADDLVSRKGDGRRPPVAAGPCSRTTASRGQECGMPRIEVTRTPSS
jgi:hypothetical protein